MLNKFRIVTNLSFVYVCFKYALYITSGIALFFFAASRGLQIDVIFLGALAYEPKCGGKGELRGHSQ